MSARQKPRLPCSAEGRREPSGPHKGSSRAANAGSAPNRPYARRVGPPVTAARFVFVALETARRLARETSLEELLSLSGMQSALEHTRFGDCSVL
jgi:hypothetical protein